MKFQKTIFESWIQSIYNVGFAVFQPVAIGMFDQYVSARMLDRYPQMYKLGQSSEFYNYNTFWAWIANSFFHSFVIYKCVMLTYGENTFILDGYNANLWLIGMMMYTTDLLTITLKAALVIDTWVKFSYFAIFGSIGLWFVFYPLWATFGPMIPMSPELYGTSPLMFGAPGFWFGIIIIPILANLRDFVWKL
jgi:phospholipid-transporting ATPase